MKKTIFLLSFLIFGICFSQNPDRFRDGIRTKFVQPDTLSTSIRDALTAKLGTLIYHKDGDSIARWEQWDGLTWIEFGGSIEWGNIIGTLSDQTDLQSALDTKQETITGAASTIVTSDLPINRALISNGSGKVSESAVTSTELSYLTGVTSNLQTQINAKTSPQTLQEVLNVGGTFTKTSGTAISGTISGTGTGINISNSGSGGGAGIYVNNSGASFGINGANSSTGRGIYFTNSGGGLGIYVDNSSTGRALELNNSGSGFGLYTENSSSGRGVYITNTSSGRGININNTGTGDAIDIINSSTAIGVDVNNSSTGIGFQSINSSTGDGGRIQNDSSGRGLWVSNLTTGIGIRVSNSSTGSGIVSTSASGGTGFVFVGQQEGVDKFTVDPAGNIITNGTITVNNSSISETGNMVIAHNTGSGLILFRPVGSGSGTGQMTLDTSGILTAVQYKLSSLNTAPASAGATGTTGEIRIDASYIYICTATNTWKRVAISTW